MVRAFDLPEAPGAYVLLIGLARPLELPIARLSRPTLAPGNYVYCGSARGPGGLAARVGRHLRQDKRPHWHVDHLTAVPDRRIGMRTAPAHQQPQRRLPAGARVRQQRLP